MIDVWSCLDVSYDEVLDFTTHLKDEESRLNYLSELASHLWDDPDKCDQWACDTLNQFEKELEND